MDYFTFFGYCAVLRLNLLFRLVRFHSPLLSESRLISFPFPIEMFYFGKLRYLRFPLGSPTFFISIYPLIPYPVLLVRWTGQVARKVNCGFWTGALLLYKFASFSLINPLNYFLMLLLYCHRYFYIDFYLKE